jgi:hypothetical protein
VQLIQTRALHEEAPVPIKPRSPAALNGHASGNSRHKGPQSAAAADRNGKHKPKIADVTDDLEPLRIDEDEAVDDDASEFDAGDIEGDAAIDDPVRMYLMQMGEIPMLNRDSEVAAAVQIEATRRRFRRTMLCSDFMLHAAVELLQKVSDGTLRLDRTIEISVTKPRDSSAAAGKEPGRLPRGRQQAGVRRREALRLAATDRSPQQSRPTRGRAQSADPTAVAADVAAPRDFAADDGR